MADHKLSVAVCGAFTVGAGLVYRRLHAYTYTGYAYGALTLRSNALVRSKPSLLLVSDLDGTLAGVGARASADRAARDESVASLAEFNAAWCARAAACDAYLCYSTGRELHSYEDLVARLAKYARSEACPLMQPNILITHDGTRIDWFDDPSSPAARHDAEWDERMASAWDEAYVLRVFADAVAARGAESLVHSVERLKLEEGVSCDPYRYSVLIDDVEVATALCDDIQRVFDAAEADRYGVFWCSGGPKNTFWLAALPRCGGKGNALEFVRSKLDAERGATFVAGDAGNVSHKRVGSSLLSFSLCFLLLLTMFSPYLSLSLSFSLSLKNRTSRCSRLQVCAALPLPTRTMSSAPSSTRPPRSTSLPRVASLEAS